MSDYQAGESIVFVIVDVNPTLFSEILKRVIAALILT